ncbi:MAG: hypothetical protein WC509_02850 [Candidatus Izemoplasmatales bacterium]
MTYAESRQYWVDRPLAAIGTTDGGAERPVFSDVARFGFLSDECSSGRRDVDANRRHDGILLPARGILREYLATEEPPSTVASHDRIPHPFPLSFALVPLGNPRGRRIGSRVLNAPIRIL